MSLTIETVTFDCTDPDALAGWWAQAVGGTVTPVMPGEFVLVALAAGAKLGFQRVDDPTPGKNRLHLDFSAADPAAEVARLIAEGLRCKRRAAFATLPSASKTSSVTSKLRSGLDTARR